MLTRTCQLVAASTLVLLATSALADDATDLVVLSNGGRVRGSVLEQSPTSGVRIKLYDGSVRSYSSAEIRRVRFADGGVANAVGTQEPETSTVDDAHESAVPGEIDQRESSGHVRAHSGEGNEADVEPTGAIKIARAHSGIHFDLGAMAGSRFQRSTLIPGGGLRLGVTYGVTPVLELIGGLEFGYYAGNIDHADYSGLFGARYPQCVNLDHNCVLSTATQTSIPIRVRLDWELHLGTVYSMMLGVDAGASVELQGATASAAETAPVVPNVDVIPIVGVHGSLLTFRFGPRRELGISLQQGAVFGGDTPAFEQTVGLHYSFL